MAKAYAKFLCDIWFNPQSKTLNPREVKETIAREFYVYESFDQQDAPEFVSQLLSLLAEDCNTVIEKPFVEHPDMVDLSDKEIADIYW